MFFYLRQTSFYSVERDKLFCCCQFAEQIIKKKQKKHTPPLAINWLAPKELQLYIAAAKKQEPVAAEGTGAWPPGAPRGGGAEKAETNF